MYTLEEELLVRLIAQENDRMLNELIDKSRLEIRRIKANQVTIKLDRDLLKHINGLANRTGKSRNQIISDAMLEVLTGLPH